MGNQISELFVMVKKSPTNEAKIRKVYGEFKAGTLKSSSGKPVTKKSQAIAIALSEASRPTRKRRSRRAKKV